MSKTITKKAKKKPTRTTVVHGVSEDETVHVVGIGNLRVVIVPDGDCWFAQGLEIDYAVQGSDKEDAKKKFECGLAATVDQHIQMYGNIEKLLKVAPPEVWKEFLSDPAANRNFYSQVTAHDLSDKIPYAGIQYLIAREANG